jgi:DNA-directed RNA polymerase subunit RPC12/RpoP
MATILKCPRCQQSMDVTSVSAGTTVRCPDCGQMARVPSGKTSLRAKTVSAPIPAKPPPPAPAPAARERGTRIRDRNRASGTMPVSPPKKSSRGGLFIGLGIGAVAVIGVVVFFLMKEQPKETPPATPPSPRASTQTKEPAAVLPKPAPPPVKPVEGRTEEPKPTVIARPSEAVDNVDWDRLMRDLRPGGGFEHLDRPEGVAFQKVKSFGKAAYPKLVRYIYIDDEQEPTISVAAVAVLNALTGRDTPLPKAANRAKAKAEWEEWLKSPDAAKEPPK